MLTAKTVPTAEKVIADRSLRGGAFQCPNCREPVSLKAGDIVVAHFAHRVGAVCAWAGESREHAQTKRAIYDMIAGGIAASGRQADYSVELEKNLGPARPDVWLDDRARGVRVAIEVQASALTAETILERTARYRRLATHVLWVVPYDRSRFRPSGQFGAQHGEIRLKAYEKIVSQMGFKTLVAWDLDPSAPRGFTAMRLGDTYGEGSDFYDSNGDQQSFEGRRRKTVKGVTELRTGVKLGHLSPTFAKEFFGRGLKYALPERLVMTYDWRKDPAAPRAHVRPA